MVSAQHHNRIHDIVWDLFPLDHNAHRLNGALYFLVENGARDDPSITIGHRGHSNFYVHDDCIDVYPHGGMVDPINQTDALLIQGACEARGIKLPINYHLGHN